MNVTPEQPTTAPLNCSSQRQLELNVVATEPSHIHIPRPSRLRHARLAATDEPAQLARLPGELVLEQAA